MVVRNRMPGEIKAMLELRGLNMAMLARARGRGMTRQILSNALVKPHTLGEQIIAEALDVLPATLWPQRYLPNGKRKSPQPRDAYRVTARFSQRKSA